MKLKKYFLIFCCFALAGLAGCGDDNADYTTTVIARSQVEKTPGFTWFEMKVAVYQPNESVVTAIKSKLTDKDYFYFFAAPACSCDSLQNVFPDAVKTIDRAGISTSRQVFVAIQNINASNPFGSAFVLTELPEIFLVRDSLPVYSIADTFRTRNDLAKKDPAVKPVTVEEVILEALSK